jgi:hypothetical protein
MARFPIIDGPCPLPPEELAAIAGDCGHCGKTVHSLDGMDDAERSAWMSKASGKVCVSYRLPLRIAAALALSVASPVFGQDSQPPCDTEPRRTATEIVVFGGTVREAASARWTEDLSLPELPTAPDDG